MAEGDKMRKSGMYMYFVVSYIPLLILEILFFVKMWPIGAGVMATKRFGFYDGVARILGQRILDFVLFQALCGFWGLTL